ncbi:MAG: glycosyltransferase [Candidatus Pelagibacter sp. TMED118]|nr:MAG: glycosyltransferase [Candidatus Pelagibacter sp. TMED118]|tara:strand:- start:1570 stop:2262 length:693 start_codon:yes stop_codon:yes gene_type:complete
MYSIILPVFNELENLKILIPEITKKLEDKKFEIVIVDDNSQDGTSEYFKQPSEFIRYINRFNKEASLGASVGDGISISLYDNVILMDSDLSHRAEFLKDLISQKEKNNYDLVCCSRFMNDKPEIFSLRFYCSKIYCSILKPFLGIQTNDGLSGFFLLDKNKIKDANFDKIFYGYGDYYFRLLFQLKKIKVKFNVISFQWQDRSIGKSKTKFVKTFLNYTYEAIKLKLFKN